MRFRLRYSRHDFALSRGQFVIGRSGECQLAIDDTLVSRRHAVLKVSDATVFIEDLGSRNGVRVNGERITGSHALVAGDLIQIGAQELRLTVSEPSEEALTAGVASERSQGFFVLGALADKAFALGRADEAERLLASHLMGLLDEVRAGRKVDNDAVDWCASYAVKLAQATGRGHWYDYVFALYEPLKRVCPTHIVDEVCAGAERVDKFDLSGLRRYLEGLRESTQMLRPTERFLLNRVESLEERMRFR